jgi:sulfite reductase (ferredoxin)
MSADDNPSDLFDLPSARYWADTLKTQIPSGLAEEINVFETEIRLKKQGKIDDKVFAETRLRRGAYGQRYDNGQRNDGQNDYALAFPNRSKLTKGPGTQWDAPGMLRIKIPYGGLTTAQIETIADVAEEYSDSILHVTTRQDFQLHFVHIEDMPVIFRRLAAVGITTREACGNSVRNVTACPTAGTCTDEAFDVTPYAKALADFLLGHPDTQDFGRKFKFSFSGCDDKPCGLVKLHDMGFVAKTKTVNGQIQRGFAAYIGGGLGAIPYQAQLLNEFVPEDELLPLAQAVSRVFARHGEKAKRNRARIKFLISDWGIEKFRQTVADERETLPIDSRWTAYLSQLEQTTEQPCRPVQPEPVRTDALYLQWRKTNVQNQRQAGYAIVHVTLPLGDMSSNQARALATIAQRYVGDTIRATADQNIVLRWVSLGDLPTLYDALSNAKLARPHANTITDVIACPGTDTCKLGISASRGLAAHLNEEFAAKQDQLDPAIAALSIKISGCFNSCAQHHIADMGFYGVSRKVGNYMLPHFQVLLGGQKTNNASSYGQAVVAIPSKAVPGAIDKLTQWYLSDRQGHEAFADFITRQGKGAVKTKLDPFTKVPDYASDPDFYKDWGDVREYSKKDIGIGECAGEVVSLTDFGLASADRKLFDAQLKFDAGDTLMAAQDAVLAMLEAAQALVKGQNQFAASERETIVTNFKKMFYDTKLAFDPFQADKFLNFFFKAVELELASLSKEHSRILIEETQLFIEACNSTHVRISMG